MEQGNGVGTFEKSGVTAFGLSLVALSSDNLGRRANMTITNF